MDNDCGAATVTGVILLIAVTVLVGGILTAAVLSSDSFPSAEPAVSAVLTVSGSTASLVFPDDVGIEQICLHSSMGDYLFSGTSPVLIPEELLESPASISAEFSDGKETVLVRI
ncbi:MAG TPA: type IV pilin [Methanocorpusculum sp.]|nr:type IV pilin [Methanocorpusculum sp.]